MYTTDTSEAGLEALIVRSLVGKAAADDQIKDSGAGYFVGAPYYVEGNPADYDRDHAVDWVKLLAFLEATQPQAVEALNLAKAGPARQKFLHRLQGEIAKRGVIDVLRSGVKHGPTTVDLFLAPPRRATPRPPNCTCKTFSASPASCSTAKTTPNWPSICACSSMACLLPPLNSKTT